MSDEQKSTDGIVAFKGFDGNMQCRGYQFEVGKTYVHDGKVEACKSGFHSCENPMDVWKYYDIGSDNRFAVVKAFGSIARHDEDSKVASASITIEAELKLPEFIAYAINWIKKACEFTGENIASGDYSQLAASGDSSIAVACAPNCTAKIGKNGTMVLTRWVENEKRYRVSVAYEGENGIKADTYYTINNNGDFVEVW